jgi:hypothetical protein
MRPPISWQGINFPFEIMESLRTQVNFVIGVPRKDFSPLIGS